VSSTPSGWSQTSSQPKNRPRRKNHQSVTPANNIFVRYANLHLRDYRSGKTSATFRGKARHERRAVAGRPGNRRTGTSSDLRRLRGACRRQCERSCSAAHWRLRAGLRLPSLTALSSRAPKAFGARDLPRRHESVLRLHDDERQPSCSLHWRDQRS